MDLKWIKRCKIGATLDIRIQRRLGPFGSRNHDPSGGLINRRVFVTYCRLPNRPWAVAASLIELSVSQAVRTFCID